MIFRNFWPDFDKNQNFWTTLFSLPAFMPFKEKVCVTSVFTESGLFKKSLHYFSRYTGNSGGKKYTQIYEYRHPDPLNGFLNIWFSAENLRPPTSGYDISISFDPSDADIAVPNIYLPYWLYNCDWNMGPRLDLRQGAPNINELQSSLSRGNSSGRTKFCCAFFNNLNPERRRVLACLGKIGDVDVFGSAVGKIVESKIEIASNYQFMYCPENSYFPGYVTEKLFESQRSGCVPIWSGIAGDTPINRASLVDITGMASHDIASTIKPFLHSSESRSNILRQPILGEPPDVIGIRDQFLRLLEKASS